MPNKSPIAYAIYPCLAVVSCLVLCGCGPSDSDYREAVKNGRATIPDVVAFEKVFTDTNHFITHYNIKGDIRQWQSEAFLYDRYIITLVVEDVVFDASDTHVKEWGRVHYYVWEIVEVNGHITRYGQGVEFDSQKWKDLEAARGDLSAVGIKVNKTPVPGFEIEKARNRG